MIENWKRFMVNPVERQRKEIIILKLYLYTKPILMQDGERLNLVISRHNTFKAVSLKQSLKERLKERLKQRKLFFFV